MTSELEWTAAATKIRAALGSERGAQKRMHLRTGIDEGTLSRYLSGKNVPNAVDAMKMARFVNLDLAEAFGTPSISEQGATARFGGTDRELDGIGVPLVAIDVAAGDGALTPIADLDDSKIYFFHEAWMREKFQWHRGQTDRFACVKLGGGATAESMEPTLRPRSLLLVDRKPRLERLRAHAREIYLVRPPDEKETVKRVTLDGGTMVLESDNPLPRYAPRCVSVVGEAFRDVVRGRVVWWATEA